MASSVLPWAAKTKMWDSRLADSGEFFLFGGGAGEPANPKYVLEFTAASGELTVAKVQLPLENDGRPSAGSVVLFGNYTLKDAMTGEIITRGTRNITAAFDRPRQEYAVARAKRDAENRAARELAEFIRLQIAQKI